MFVKGQSVTVTYIAINAQTLARVSGDQANHTLKGYADGVEFTPAASPVAKSNGEYSIVISAAENTGDGMSIDGTSSTPNVTIVGKNWQNFPVGFSTNITGSLSVAARFQTNKKLLLGDSILLAESSSFLRVDDQPLVSVGTGVGSTNAIFNQTFLNGSAAAAVTQIDTSTATAGGAAVVGPSGNPSLSTHGWVEWILNGSTPSSGAGNAWYTNRLLDVGGINNSDNSISEDTIYHAGNLSRYHLTARLWYWRNPNGVNGLRINSVPANTTGFGTTGLQTTILNTQGTLSLQYVDIDIATPTSYDGTRGWRIAVCLPDGIATVNNAAFIYDSLEIMKAGQTGSGYECWAIGGWDIDRFIATNICTDANFQAAVAGKNFGTVLIQLGANNPAGNTIAQTVTKTNTLINRIRGAIPTCDIVLCSQYQLCDTTGNPGTALTENGSRQANLDITTAAYAQVAAATPQCLYLDMDKVHGDGIFVARNYLANVLGDVWTHPTSFLGTDYFAGNIIRSVGKAYGTVTPTGSGAYAITVHVTDGTNPISNASVRMGNFSGQTNASGNIVFSLDAATYLLSITYGGYSYTPTSQVVSANATINAAMTVVSLAPATGAGQCNVYVTCLDTSGSLRPTAVVEFRIASTGIGTGYAFPGTWVQAAANTNAVATCLMANGLTYNLRIDQGNIASYSVTNAGAATLSLDLLGRTN